MVVLLIMGVLKVETGRFCRNSRRPERKLYWGGFYSPITTSRRTVSVRRLIIINLQSREVALWFYARASTSKARDLFSFGLRFNGLMALL